MGRVLKNYGGGWKCGPRYTLYSTCVGYLFVVIILVFQSHLSVLLSVYSVAISVSFAKYKIN